MLLIVFPTGSTLTLNHISSAISPSVINPNVPSVLVTIKVGKTPFPAAFNPASGDLYVPNNGSGTVSVISGTAVIKTIKVGSQPQQALLNSATNEIYVLNKKSNNVIVIGSSNNIRANISIPGPFGLFFDPANGNIYVTVSSSSSTKPGLVYRINSLTYSVTKITVGINPSPYMVYDPANGEMLIGNSVFSFKTGFGNLSAINSTTNKVKTITLAGVPLIISILNFASTAPYSAATKDIYVPVINPFTGKENLTAISSKNKIVAKIANVAGFGIYDPTNKDLYIANGIFSSFGKTNVTTIINSKNAFVTNVTTGMGAIIPSYDPANHEVYVANSKSNTTTVVNSASIPTVVKTIKVGPYPVVAFYDSGDNDMFVLNANYNVMTMKPAGPGSLTAISSTNVVLATLKVGTNPIGIVLNPNNNDLYVTNSGSGTLTMIAS